MTISAPPYKAALAVIEYDMDFVLTSLGERVEEGSTVYGPPMPTKLSALEALFKQLRAESHYWRADATTPHHINDKVIRVRKWIQDIFAGCTMGTIDPDDLSEWHLYGNWDVEVSVVPVARLRKAPAPTVAPSQQAVDLLQGTINHWKFILNERPSDNMIYHRPTIAAMLKDFQARGDKIQENKQ